MAQRNQNHHPETSERKETALAQPSSILKISSLLTPITLLTLLLTVPVVTAADKPVHLFILSGQSNMARMNPNAGFIPEAGKLFKDEEVVYIKVSKGSQPICRWLEEWQDIAKENGLDEKAHTENPQGAGGRALSADSGSVSGDAGEIPQADFRHVLLDAGRERCPGSGTSGV